MKVEVLYIAGCPSHAAAVRLVKDVLTAEGIVADIDEVLVKDDLMAHELRFIGSPTVRINGRDVDEISRVPRNFCLSCRMYPGSKQIGLPAPELVQRAIVEASIDDSSRKKGALNLDQSSTPTTVRCPNCGAKLIVYVAVRENPLGAELQTVVCASCNQAFRAMRPDKIVGRPSLAPER